MPIARIPRRVTVFALGGTIAMSGDQTRGVTPSLSAEQLLAAVPGLADSAITLEVVDFRQLPGASLTIPDITALAAAIGDQPADIDGTVVTQGTDTIEETAYLLDLLHPGPAPIVVTGAMRNPTLAGADGPANLLAAIRTAADPQARGHGCLVVFNDEIHAARRVRKTHTTSTATFRSLTGGPLGYLVEHTPRFLGTPLQRHTVPTGPGRNPRVALVPVVLGDDGAVLEAVADRVDGIVLAAMGAGHVPAVLVPALAALAARVPVVLASRVGAGPVLESTYGFPGSERDLLARGLVGAGDLHPFKARLLLHTVLAAGGDRSTVRRAFAVAGGYAPSHTWPWPIAEL
ncbi:asparaginase [Nocardia bovistercoris]|uniref:Asparaginase n=1 Tax=Nocardia bovistercoris TaxID=2785916 RepID=A0A931IHA2_9NOCA|nr:asparaginase [Nocardia bovistercoris]